MLLGSFTNAILQFTDLCLVCFLGAAASQQCYSNSGGHADCCNLTVIGGD